MPTPTYDLLASSVLTSSASSVTFSSISGSYRDLIIVVTATNSTNAQLRIKPNGVTTNLTSVSAEGRTNGDTFSASFNDIGQAFLYNYLGSTRSTQIIHFFDYTENKHKSVLFRANSAANGVSIHAGRWASTSAITSIEIANDGGTLDIGSSFYLYGIVS